MFIPIKILLLFAVFSCGKGGTNDSAPDTKGPNPVVSTLNVSQKISASDATMQFYINLSQPATKQVSVDYSFADGTAVSPADYMATSGTLSIPAGEVHSSVDVHVKGDPTDLRRTNKQFTLLLTKPIGCTIGTATVTGTIVTEDGTYLPTDNSGYSTPNSYPGYTMLWSDEFSASGLEPNSWNYEIGNGSNGWGNHELEYYTSSPKNCFLSGGNLVVEARKEPVGGFNYTSSRITTQNKKTFKFGRIDIRAKLPVSKGMWPALWMLGSNITSAGWPACGEMDIMELIGTNPDRVRSTMHWQSAGGAHSSKGADYFLLSGDYSLQFHVFSMVWEKDMIKNYVDDKLILTITNADLNISNNPFNAEQFFIFNVAVGGDWPGPPDANTLFPQRMFVDYVRVFQKN